MKKLAALLPFLLVGSLVFGQFDPNYKKTDYSMVNDEPSMVNLGIGLGLDYGGIGGKLSFFPIHSVGIFAGVGYNFLGAGYNFGGIGRILPKQKICPFFTAMYGYNALIIIEGMDEKNKAYFGATVGGGMEIRFKNQQHYLNVETLVPIHGNDYINDLNELMNNPAVEMTEPMPFQISVGYHVKI